MVKYYCDICNSNNCVMEKTEFLNKLKERLGEKGLYKTIEENLSYFGKEYIVKKTVVHICEDCCLKIQKGIYSHYQGLFDSFFEEK